jgi:hypothetical protein
MLRTRSTVATLALLLAACGGDSGGIDGSTGPNAPVPATPVGTYVLKTVDGKPLPAPIGKPVVEQEYTLQSRALNGQFTFNADSTFKFTANAEVVATGIDYKWPIPTIERSGTYTYDASTITLKSSSGVTTMTRVGSTLTSSVQLPAAGGGKEVVTMVFSR